MNSRITLALESAPSSMKALLSDIVLADNFDATLSPEQFSSLLQASGLADDELRIALLPFAAAYSYAPLSDFYVGAIVRGLSGTLYFGANLEIAGAQLGQTVHAEQSAISHAWMKGEQGISDITINFSPCGHCRQFVHELAAVSTRAEVDCDIRDTFFCLPSGLKMVNSSASIWIGLFLSNAWVPSLI